MDDQGMNRQQAVAQACRLRVHPAGDVSGLCGRALRGLQVVPAFDADGALLLEYRLQADLSQLRVPEPAQPRACEGLWQHTCMEAFIGSGGGDYVEFNFSPSGEWACYRFAAYRQALDEPFGGGSPSRSGPVPECSTTCAVDGLHLRARIPPGLLPVASPGGAWVLGLSAVLEGRAGELAYLALHHPCARPDFHHHEGFVLRLAPPRDAVVQPRAARTLQSLQPMPEGSNCP